MFVFTAAESHAHLKKHEEFMSSVREGNVEDIQQMVIHIQYKTMINVFEIILCMYLKTISPDVPRFTFVCSIYN